MTEWTPETVIAASVAGEAPQTTPEAFSALEPEVIALWRLNGGIEWAILLSVTFVIITVGSIVLSLGLWFWALLAAGCWHWLWRWFRPSGIRRWLPLLRLPHH